MNVAGPKFEALEADKQRLTVGLAEQEPENTIVSLHPVALTEAPNFHPTYAWPRSGYDGSGGPLPPVAPD